MRQRRTRKTHEPAILDGHLRGGVRRGSGWGEDGYNIDMAIHSRHRQTDDHAYTLSMPCRTELVIE